MTPTLEIEKPEALRGVEHSERYQQVLLDSATWAAEALDGVMRTSFEFSYSNGDLVSDDGRGMTEVFDDAIVDAERFITKNPELSFELRRRKKERQELDIMLAMARGEAPNTMVVVSDFPQELMSKSQDVGGYNTRRRQTMMRVITLEQDGRIKITTQSLDQSNRRSLEAIYGYFGKYPESGELLGQRIQEDLTPEQQAALCDNLKAAYDRMMAAQYGGDWHAGRHPADYQNTYDFVWLQQDLLHEFARMQVHGKTSEKDFYNFAAALTARKNSAYINTEKSGSELRSEMSGAGAIAQDQGVVFSGCGLSAGGGGQMGEMGYGNLAGEDRFGPLAFDCPRGHLNIRPRNTLMESCKTCGCSLKCG